jgi:hypothetical protein
MKIKQFANSMNVKLFFAFWLIMALSVVSTYFIYEQFSDNSRIISPTKKQLLKLNRLKVALKMNLS